MRLRQLFDPESSTYTYLVGDEDTRLAAVIDPVRERIDEILAALAEDGLTLLYSLDTHVHADHVTASGLLREKTGARVAMGLGNACGCADLPLREGDVLTVGRHRLRVLETPGHTPDGVCYVLDESAVFTGDTLLVGTCGRTDFQGGDAGQLYDSIHRKLFVLPDATVVYPGHDYEGRTSTTIGAEKTGNARAAGRTRDDFIQLMAGLKLPPPKKIAEAVPQNLNCGLPTHAS